LFKHEYARDLQEDGVDLIIFLLFL